ncbi:MAG: hypothetical protein ACOCUT_04075, partial [bacterium]
MSVLSLSGKIGVGKTSVADFVTPKFAENITVGRYGFGDLLKRECSQNFDFDLSLAYSQSGKNTIIKHPDLPKGQMSIREILQWWGTDIRREQNEDYWVLEMERFYSEFQGDLLIIDDVRFPNEADFGKNSGFLVRIHPYDGWIPGPYASHESETALDNYRDWDLEIKPDFGKLEIASDFIFDLSKRFS